MSVSILLSILLIAAHASAQSAERTAQTERTVEATLALKDLTGHESSLSAYAGRIIVLNFWATWCVPCRKEMPILTELNRLYANRGVQFIAASADEVETQSKVPIVAKRLKIDFPVWIGATVSDMQRLGVGAALPATLVIDRDGKIAGRIIGLVEKADLTRRIDWLLGDRTSAAPEPLVNTIELHQHDHTGEKGERHQEEEHEHGGVGVEGASTVPS